MRFGVLLISAFFGCVTQDFLGVWIKVPSHPSFENPVAILHAKVESCDDVLGWEALPERVHEYLLYARKNRYGAVGDSFWPS